ncbi:phage major capsid protein [Azonexus sp. IMCC34839]|uniref:phage major capsid protein n=1 Tax=Azonexus sp. IMCC34839 TaxID=3133695 RepID=UPI00399AE92C
MTQFNFEELSAVAKSAKEAVENVKKSHQDLDSRVEKLHQEIKEGKADVVTKTAFQEAVLRVEKAEQSLDKVNDELGKLMSKAEASFKQNTAKTLGQMAAESDAAKNYKGGNVELCTMAGPLFAKAAVTSGQGSAGVLIEPYRVPGILMEPDTPLTIRDLFSSVSISTNAIEWVKEKIFTNNAGPQNGEGTVKPESGITFEKKTSAVETIAHWIPASRQVLADAPQLRGIIDGKLRTGLKFKEDEALMFGDGTNGNLLGLVPQATPYSPAGIPANPNKIDHLRWAILQVTKAKYPATFAVMSLEDWATIQMMKTADGAYIFGTPTDGAAPRIWGKRVVESFGLETGDFLVGSSMAATIYDREDVSVRVAEQHADFFIKNMVAILCEERLGFTVERPQAIVSGSFN